MPLSSSINRLFIPFGKANGIIVPTSKITIFFSLKNNNNLELNSCSRNQTVFYGWRIIIIIIHREITLVCSNCSNAVLLKWLFKFTNKILHWVRFLTFRIKSTHLHGKHANAVFFFFLMINFHSLCKTKRTIIFVLLLCEFVIW